VTYWTYVLPAVFQNSSAMKSMNLTDFHALFEINLTFLISYSPHHVMPRCKVLNLKFRCNVACFLAYHNFMWMDFKWFWPSPFYRCFQINYSGKGSSVKVDLQFEKIKYKIAVSKRISHLKKIRTKWNDLSLHCEKDCWPPDIWGVLGSFGIGCS